MNRQKFVEIAYQKGKELNLNNKQYLSWLDDFFNKQYCADVGAGDITSKAVLFKNEFKTAFFKVKSRGFLGGLEEVSWFLKKHQLDANLCFSDGEEVMKGETVLIVKGDQKTILATERIVLNVLQRMSGITTETKRLGDLLKDSNTQIAATRKTLLSYIDKKAIYLGGGLTHRFGLWDSILIKDNHLEALKSEGIADYAEVAIARASVYADSVRFIEIEVTTVEEAVTAARKFRNLHLKTPCAIMLDNMKPAMIAETLETLRECDPLYDSVLLEASGEITSENIHEYAKTGVDVISLGYLTHSSTVLDLSLEMTF